MSQNQVSLSDIAQDVLRHITELLPAFSLVNLFLTGSQRLQMLLTIPGVVRRFVVSASDDVNGHLRLRRLESVGKYFDLPSLLYMLPTLSVVVFEWQGALGISEIMQQSVLASLPSSVTHLSLLAPISLRIERGSRVLFNFGVKFPNLRVLALGKDIEPLYAFVGPDATWISLLQNLPPSLEHLTLCTGSTARGLDAMIPHLPKSITSFSSPTHRTQDGLALHLLAPFHLQSITTFKLFTEEPFIMIPSLTELHVNQFSAELLPLLPASMRIFCVLESVKWSDTHVESEWLQFMSALPKSLKIVALPSFRQGLGRSVPSRGDKPTSLLSTEPEICDSTRFPTALESLNVNFNDALLASQRSHSNQSLITYPKSLTSLLLAGHCAMSLRALAATSLANPFYFPSSLTSLSLPAPWEFAEDYWQCLPKLTYLDLSRSVISFPESLLFSPYVPHTLMEARLNILDVTGMSWNILRVAASYPNNRQETGQGQGRIFQNMPILPHNRPEAIQLFLHSVERANVNAYSEAFSRAIAFKYPYNSLKVGYVKSSLSRVLVLPPAVTTVNWRKIPLAAFPEEPFPTGLRWLNLRGASVPFLFLPHIPPTIERVTGAVVAFPDMEEMKNLGAIYFGNWRSIDLSGSFSRAVECLYPTVRGCKVTMDFQFSTEEIFDWIPPNAERLRLCNFADSLILNSDDLLDHIDRFKCIKEIDCHWKSVITDGLAFSQMPNLRKMSLSIGTSFISFLPKILAHLSLTCDYSSGKLDPSHWPPHLTHLELKGSHANSLFESLLFPALFPCLQTLILTNVYPNDSQIQKLPRSLTSLRFKSYTTRLTNDCIPNLPPHLQEFKTCGAFPDRRLVFEYLHGKR